MLEWFEKMKRRARTRRELNSLSDYELRDIGISRYDIERIAAETV